jgi:hypothetical protein
MSVPPPLPVTRSTFVSVVAWIFVGLSGFMSFFILLDSLLLPTVFLPMLQQMPPATTESSPYLSWYLGHIVWLCGLALLLSLAHLLASIGLLKRRNWGRRLFIGLLGVDIAYQLAGAALQWWLLSPMQHAMLQAQFASMPQPLPAEQQAQLLQMMDSMLGVMRVFSLLVAAAFVVLFAWIIKRLCSTLVRREFVPPSLAA